MKNELKLVRIDTEYCNFLRRFDSRVPYNFNEKELRPFIGVLFEVMVVAILPLYQAQSQNT